MSEAISWSTEDTRTPTTRVGVLALLIPVLVVIGCEQSLDPDFDPNEITIHVDGAGNGNGHVTGPTATQIDCAITGGSAGLSSGCRESFVDAGAGGAFTLDAVADTSSTFLGFSGDCTGPVCSLSFPQGSDTTFAVTARFILLPPSVTIEEPLDGAMVPASSPTGASIPFRATARDRTGTLLAGLDWTSSLQGSLCTPVSGFGCTAFSRELLVGVHTITATVNDQAGTPASSSIRVTVLPPGNFPPEAEIVTPVSGASVPAELPLRMGGFGRDPEDGPLPGASLFWTSSMDGALGMGSNLDVMLSVGSHRISLTATDSRGATGIDTVTITVTPPAGGPGTIAGRVTGNGFGVVGATLTLAGPVSLTTTSGNGGNYAFTMLPAGVYTVTVSVALNINFPSPTQIVTLLSGQTVTLDFAGTY